MRRHLGNEQGVAMMTAIMASIVIGLLIVAISLAADNMVGRTKQQADRAVGMPVADSAVSSYEYALQSGLAASENGYMLDGTALAQLAAMRGDEVVANVDLPFAELRDIDPDMPVDTHFTMRQPVGDGSVGFWQIYRVQPPHSLGLSGGPRLVVYLRAWVASETGSVATQPRMLRIEYRAGSFSDYQLLVDNDLFLADGTVVDGPVHSNGYLDGMSPHPYGPHRVWGEGRVTCTENAKVTSAQGNIHLSPRCNFVQQNQNFVNFARIDEAFDLIRASCGKTGVRCYTPIDGSYRVRLDGDRTTVNGVSVDMAGVELLAFMDDITIEGTANGRLTVASMQAPDGSQGGTITVTGDTQTAGGEGEVLGLFSDGDIVVDTSGCQVQVIHAALVAGHGTVTVDPRLLSPGGDHAMISGSHYCDQQLLLKGAVASSHSPQLYWRRGWTWNGNGVNGQVGYNTGPTTAETPGDVGYAERKYTWDQNMVRNPPPFFPWTDRWEFASWKDANQDCLGARRMDHTCS